MVDDEDQGSSRRQIPTRPALAPASVDVVIWAPNTNTAAPRLERISFLGATILFVSNLRLHTLFLNFKD